MITKPCNFAHYVRHTAGKAKSQRQQRGFRFLDRNRHIQRKTEKRDRDICSTSMYIIQLFCTLFWKSFVQPTNTQRIRRTYFFLPCLKERMCYNNRDRNLYSILNLLHKQVLCSRLVFSIHLNFIGHNGSYITFSRQNKLFSLL